MSKPPASGRKKGTPNKANATIAERLTALGCDPIEGLARIAMNERHSIEIRLRAYAELAPYAYPKWRTAEFNSADGQPIGNRIINVTFVTPEPVPLNGH